MLVQVLFSQFNYCPVLQFNITFSWVRGGEKIIMIRKDTKKRIDEWVSENYLWFLGEVKTNIAKHRMSQYADDLVIHMIETLYTQDDDKINKMLDEDKVGWWLLVGAGVQLRSSTSPFYRIYRKEKSWSREEGYEGSFANIFDHPDEPYNGELYDCFHQSFEELHWYQKKIMTMFWYEGKTLQEIYEHYNIGKNHLVKDINTAINQIREKCQHC